MNIAILCGRDIRRTEDTDGGSVLVRNLARELLHVGHAVEIFVPGNTIGGSAHERTYEDETEDEFTIKRFPVDLAGLDLESGGEDPHVYFLNRIAISEREAEYFSDGSLLKYDRVYIIHIAHAFGLMHRGLVPADRTVIFPMMLGSFYGAFESVPAAYTQMERRTLTEARHIATVSDAEQAVLTDVYGVPPTCIYKVGRGYDADAFKCRERSAFPSGRINLLCANVIKPQKDQRFFLDLVEAARQSGLDLHVHLVGVKGKTHRANYNQYAADLQAEVVRRNMEEYISFVDVLPQEELSELMMRSTVALYPSRTETFGKSALESMATGLPTIVFDDVPAFGEFITDGYSGLVIPRSAHAAIEALQALRDDQNLYQTLSANGVAVGRTFTWPHVIKDMVESEETRMRSS